MDTQRFAIYFTFAPDHPLYQRATQWLGHCVYNQAMEKVAEFSPASEKFRSIQQAAHYGFHATLKPPFRLQAGTTQAELENCLQEFTSRIKPFTCAALRVKSIGDFLALVPEDNCDELNQLASECVQHFEEFRAPLNEAEMQKRLRAPLTARQQSLLKQWGYPYVLDEFCFHMTLTDHLADHMIEDAQRQLELEFSSLLSSRLPVDRICLCQQSTPQKPFYLLQSYPLGGRQNKEWNQHKYFKP